MFKIEFYQMFDIFHVNLRENEGFLTCIPYIPIPENVNGTHPKIVAQKIMCLSSLFNM